MGVIFKPNYNIKINTGYIISQNSLFLFLNHDQWGRLANYCVMYLPKDYQTTIRQAKYSASNVF